MSFYKEFTAENFVKESINLTKLESWLVTKKCSALNSKTSAIEIEAKAKHSFKTLNLNTNYTSIGKDSSGNKYIHN